MEGMNAAQDVLYKRRTKKQEDARVPARDQTDETLLVAGLDFGTSYSGYCYSLRSDFMKDPTLITTNQWSYADAGVISHKAPSTLLFRPVPDMSLHSFGYEAEKKFAQLAEDEDSNGWFYFKGFKMSLMDKDLHRNSLVRDIRGKFFPVHGLLTSAIKYLKDHMEGEFKKRDLGFLDKHIHFVLTIPAIWTDAAKQLMRYSAQKAGIHPTNLTLAYEPEVAAILCRHLSTDKIIGSGVGSIIKIFEVGVVFIVVDLGGGTVDVTVQRVTEKGKLSHVHVASGGQWGGTTVNQAFMTFLGEIFTEEVMNTFRDSEMSEYLFLLRTFEIKKREANVDSSDRVVIRIPQCLIDIYNENSEVDVREKIKSLHEDKVSLKRDKLFLHREVFKSFFKCSIDKTVNHLRSLLKKKECKNVSFMLLVGGYAECPLISEAIRREFSAIRVIIPTGSDCGLAVLKGAAIYGHDPSIVESRKCPYTYGIAVHKPYDPNVHAQSRSFTMDGKERVEDCFEKLFTIDEMIPIGCKRSIPVHNTHYDEERQEWRTEHKEIEFYSSKSQNPLYVTDKDCKLHGKILVPPPSGLWPELTEGAVEVEVGGTEMIVRYVDKHSSQIVAGNVNFFPNNTEPECDHVIGETTV